MRNFDGLRRYTSELAWMPLDPLYAYKGRNIERCLLMVGYRRSGASLLGQLLNAHFESYGFENGGPRPEPEHGAVDDRP